MRRVRRSRLRAEVRRVGRSGCGDVSAVALPEGSVVALRVEPVGCGSFLGWSGSVDSAEPEIQITLREDMSLNASFEPATGVSIVCGAGGCQALAMGLIGLALMRTRQRRAT